MFCRCFIYSLPGHEKYKSPILSDEVYMLVSADSDDSFDWLFN